VLVDFRSIERKTRIRSQLLPGKTIASLLLLLLG